MVRKQLKIRKHNNKVLKILITLLNFHENNFTNYFSHYIVSNKRKLNKQSAIDFERGFQPPTLQLFYKYSMLPN